MSAETPGDGTTGEDEWSAAWRSVLPTGDADADRRIAQGRAWRRSGRVSGVRLAAGRIEGRVQGGRATPYLVEVAFAALEDTAWSRTVAVLAAEVRHRARVLVGQAPEGLAAQLAVEGISLVPSADAVTVACSCHDDVVWCAHAAAVWDAVAEEIVADPFVLTRVRGRSRERLLTELSRRGAPAGQAAASTRAVAALPPSACWSAGVGLDDLEVPRLEAAPVSAAPLRALGDPPGWPGGPSAHELLAPLVERAATWAGADGES